MFQRDFGTVAARGQKIEGKSARGMRISNFRECGVPRVKSALKNSNSDFGGFGNHIFSKNVFHSDRKADRHRFFQQFYVPFLDAISCLCSTPVAIKGAGPPFLLKSRKKSSFLSFTCLASSPQWNLAPSWSPEILFCGSHFSSLTGGWHT